MRISALLCLLASAMLLIACADPNSDAPVGGIHALDGSFLDGSVHGPVAKQDLTFCQQCHGEDGGPGDNPRFNGGDVGFSCENTGCHATDLAHPLNWAGPNLTFHYSAGNVQDACTLCHGAALDGVGGVGPSCLSCHSETADFTLDCTACHGYPPDGSPDLDVPNGVDHMDVDTVGLHQECTICHGMSESAGGGTFNPDDNYALFNKSSDTLGDHWDGNIQMNNLVGYNPSTYGCAVSCHNNDDTQDPLSDSGLPVVLENYGP
jgi:hypothetical protein